MRKISFLLIGILLAACGQNAPATQPTVSPTLVTNQPTTSIQPTATLLPTEVTNPGPDGYPGPGYPPPAAPVNAPAELVQAIRERLATKLGVATTVLNIQKGDSHEWPDTSLGCPAPNTTYQQISIPGYLLIFNDGTRDYEVHTSLAAAPGEPAIWCENKQPVDLSVAPTPPTPDAQGQAMFELARQDMAKQLTIDPTTITLLAISAVEWNDSSLGCPKPGVNYLQVITPGYIMRLDAKGVVYTYHTDARNIVVKCDL